MSIKISREAYEKLIKEDLDFLNEHCPESLELDHIKAIIRSSINWNYPEKAKSMCLKDKTKVCNLCHECERETYPTAKKEHICEFCACKIHIGQKYIRQTNVYDGTKYDFITHQECKEVARKLRMYDDCDDEGLDGESFRENLDSYVYANHYDDEADDVCSDWQLSHYEIAKKVLEELKTENRNGNRD